MGNTAPSAPAVPEIAVPVPEVAIVLPASPRYDLSVSSARDYLETRVPVGFFLGGLTGVASGYYVGELAGLYGYSGAFGVGMASTAFYGTNFLLRYARQQDDVYNYAASGCLNGFWIVAGLSRSGPRGLAGAACGSLAGAGVKLGGDWLFATSRSAWLNHRVHSTAFGRPRMLEARKPMFHPRDSRLPTSGNIIPQRNTKPLNPPVASPTPTPVAADKKGGWLW